VAHKANSRNHLVNSKPDHVLEKKDLVGSPPLTKEGDLTQLSCANAATLSCQVNSLTTEAYKKGSTCSPDNTTVKSEVVSRLKQKLAFD